jgi:Na+/proline symporter
MLLLGGSAVVSYLTDMNVIAACFLLPVGVIIYTLFGGIKATFLTDYAYVNQYYTTVLYIFQHLIIYYSLQAHCCYFYHYHFIRNDSICHFSFDW